MTGDGPGGAAAPATEFEPALADQLADVQALQADAADLLLDRRGRSTSACRRSPHNHLDILRRR